MVRRYHFNQRAWPLCCLASVEYFDRPESVMAEAARVLETGGGSAAASRSGTSPMAGPTST